jgi:hypothetical protein
MSTLIPKFDLKNGNTIPTGAINRPINLKLAETISVKDFGAVGDGTTDDTTAIQNTINAVALTGGTVYFPAGTYLISTTLQIAATSSTGIFLQGCAPACQLAYQSNIVAASSLSVMIHFGDPTESSTNPNHIYPPCGLINLAVTGAAAVTYAIRAYNIGLRFYDCYFSNVQSTTGGVVLLNKCYDSIFRNVTVQSFYNNAWYLQTENNAITFDHCPVLTGGASSNGFVITGNTYSIVWIDCDVEGVGNAWNFNGQEGPLNDFVLIDCTSEGNHSGGSAIIQTNGTYPIASMTIIGGNFQGPDSKLSFTNVIGGFLTGAKFAACQMTLNSDLKYSDFVVGPYTYDPGTGVQNYGAIVGAWKQLNSTQYFYEDNISSGSPLTVTYDMSVYTSININLYTATVASLTFVLNNLLSREPGAEILLRIGNTSALNTVGGAINFPSNLNTSSSVVIPTFNKWTAIKFQKDPNNQWWETSRATNV